MSGHSYQIYRSENGMESEVSRNSQYANFYYKNAQSDLYQQMQGQTMATLAATCFEAS